jgi:chemotaxis protein CheD
MGEIVSSADPEEELAIIGLGSCIGLAILDRRAGVAGLAHVVLPQARDEAGMRGKFADLAIPALIEELEQLGGRRATMEAAIAGGARMFAFTSDLDIGANNEAAVREALAAERIRIRGAATGGTRGRTIRVGVGSGAVTAQEAGGDLQTLIKGASA